MLGAGNEALKNDGAVFLLFGATGDLAKRKLYPAIYSLYLEGKLSNKFAVIGLARRPRTNEQYRQNVRDSIQEFARQPVQDKEASEFVEHFEYMSLDIHHLPQFQELKALTEKTERKYEIKGNRLFYLALAPELFGEVSHHLRAGGLLESDGWHRLVIEKPFGYDYYSAEKLNEEIRSEFSEDQVYRIDHYLGKEMVQNIEVMRFANEFFEPLWNNKHIANVQITLSETVGVEERGGYYDHAGALRDMGQNHMLQMVTMMAMEPPIRLHPQDIHDEKVKVLRALRGFESEEDVHARVVRGQYGAGDSKGKALAGYRDEEKVEAHSTTETYFAAKLFVDNFRWAGVPFYIRTGKRLPVKTTEVVVEFKSIPDNVYLSQGNELEPNLLVFRVNPVEGVYFRVNAKRPGSDGAIVPVNMDFSQSAEAGLNTPEAYERLLYDAARGDSTYFTRWDEVSLAWRFVDQIAAAWTKDTRDLNIYPAGSWGPMEAQQLLEEDGFHWWPVYGQKQEPHATEAVNLPEY